MKITYSLTGVDEDGNATLDLELTLEQVITILTAALKTKGEKDFVQQQVELAQIYKEVPTTPNFFNVPVKVTPAGKHNKKENVVRPKTGGKRSMTDEKRNEIINLNKAGKTDPEIIEEAGVSKSTIYRILQEAGLKSNPGLRKAHKTSYDEDEPAAVRRNAMPLNKFQQVKIALSHTIPAETIAKELNLTPQEVHKAELAKTYDIYCAS